MNKPIETLFPQALPPRPHNLFPVWLAAALAALWLIVRDLEISFETLAYGVADMGEYFSSPGMLSESFTLVRATGLSQVGPGGGTDGEDITTYRVPLAELSAFVEERRSAGIGIDVRIMGLLLAGGV